MLEENSPIDETEQIFEEYFRVLENAKNVGSSDDLNSSQLKIELMQVVESYEQLLKTSVRIAKLGDKAQRKLMKYKELMDTLRNIE